MTKKNIQTIELNLSNMSTDSILEQLDDLESHGKNELDAKYNQLLTELKIRNNKHKNNTLHITK